jgi:hypothetical protein
MKSTSKASIEKDLFGDSDDSDDDLDGEEKGSSDDEKSKPRDGPLIDGVEGDDIDSDDPDLVLKRAAQKNKTRKRKMTQEMIQEKVDALLLEMYQAWDKDNKANETGQLAANKMKLLQEVETTMNNAHLKDAFLDSQALHHLKRWLEKLPDGSPPNRQLTRGIMRILQNFGSRVRCSWWQLKS